MMKLGLTCVVAALIAGSVAGQTRGRSEFNLDPGWRFHLGDLQGAEAPAFDDNQWRQLNLPHDWSIEGPYDASAPTGGSGGYLPTGIGWYRKHFTLPPLAAGRRAWVEFDGVYENSTVWLNGQLLGTRPFGYISFHYDLTPHLAGGDNILAVRVDNSNQPNSRWYSGSGIYRHVRLVVTDPVHVGHWGQYVTTPTVSEDAATIVVRTTLVNDGSARTKDGQWKCWVIDPNGSQVVGMTSTYDPIEPGQSKQAESPPLEVHAPRLWSVETPAMYTLRTVVLNDGQVVDETITPFGIRRIEYDVDRGFLLNGKPVKMNGVCLHHEAGCVGAAVPIGVWQRRLTTLKAMGGNAIRTSHNPPAPEFLDLCDRLGFLVMDEAFDEWKIGKTRFGYSRYFDEWAEKDLTTMLRRDRNHPSVVMWSVGNEIREQPRPGGEEPLRKLVAICHTEDPTRPVTLGCDNIAADGGSTTLPFLESLDIVGYNYVDRWHERRELYYSLDRQAHPDWRFVGTESVAVRGFRNSYSLGNDPATVRPNYTTGMIRAEQLWKFVATRDYVIGDFMWTGIDYLGETRWPNRLAGSGVLDLCGFPKDSYYFYRSQWTREPMVYIFPHWNWPGREGQIIPVLADSNCDAVELFLNGKSLGEKRLEFPRPGNSGSWMRYDRPPVNATTADLHLAWDVPYAPGVLKAIGRRSGREVCTQEVRTAGEPAAIRLSVDLNSVAANGADVVHVKVEILDADGVLVPTADNLVRFTVGGQGRLIGVDNGDPRDHDSYQTPQRRAYNGLCLAIVQALREEGTIQVTAQADGLQPASIEVQARSRPPVPSL
jgi:beta-galactosidase